MTTTIRTFEHLTDWTFGATEIFGDPSEAICHLFFRWSQDPKHNPGGELVCGQSMDGIGLWIHRNHVIPVPVITGEQRMVDGNLEAFGSEKIAPGVWALTPSLNIRELHGFVVLYDVPDPAPWESPR